MKRLVLRQCIVILLFLVVSCSGAMAERTIVFGTAPPWPPSEETGRDGKVEGFSIDYVLQAGNAAGFTPVFETASREALLDGLASGKYDAVLATSVSLSGRMDEVAVSRPFCTTHQVLLMKKGTRFSSDEALRSARLAALRHSNGFDLLASMEGVEPEAYADINRAVNDLIAGKTDALVCDYPVAAYYAKSKMKSILKLTSFSRDQEPHFYTIAVKKDNREMLEVIDAGIAVVKAKGVDRELRMKWQWL